VGATILIVDDEPLVMQIMVMALRRPGYELITAESPEEVFRLCARPRTVGLQIDLAIMDVIMPRMSGPELVDSLRAQGVVPKHILYVSGFPRYFITNHRGLDPGARFLQKPFTVQKLIGVVDEIMDGDRP